MSTTGSLMRQPEDNLPLSCDEVHTIISCYPRDMCARQPETIR